MDEQGAPSGAETAGIELVLEGRATDLGGGMVVRRVLPAIRRRSVGPFVFFDHMGPSVLPPGEGVDVRPHPHINLATVTYLFDGEMRHRDSLGCDQVILPGAVNWMTAGRGIVHSERSSPEARPDTIRMHGIQAWLALPQEHEEVEPDFAHHPASSIPGAVLGDVELRVLAGSAYGMRSPVKTLSELFYVEAHVPADASLTFPEGWPERAAYVVEGEVQADRQQFAAGQLLCAREGASVRLTANRRTRLMLLGGQPLDGRRHMFWNFVSSRPERVEQAKRDWKGGRFPKVPGDDAEFIPLPES